MSRLITLTGYTAALLRDTLGEMGNTTVTQILPTSDYDSEGRRDYLVVLEHDPLPILGTPGPPAKTAGPTM